MYHMDRVVLDRGPRERIARLIPAVEEGIFMYGFDSAFLCGLLRAYRPKKVLELGVADGGSTAVILQALTDLGEPFSLHSVDVRTRAFVAPDREIGYLGGMAAEALGVSDRYALYAGAILPWVIEGIGGDIDFLILDTTHSLPGETLDFLTAFPFLSPDAVVCLHDIRQNLKLPPSPMKIATNVLFHSVAAEKYMNTDETRLSDGCPNTGAFRCTEDTARYIGNVFGALTQNWDRMPGEEELSAYEAVLRPRYREEELWLFDKAVAMNRAAFAFAGRDASRESLPGRLRRAVRRMLH